MNYGTNYLEGKHYPSDSTMNDDEGGADKSPLNDEKRMIKRKEERWKRWEGNYKWATRSIALMKVPVIVKH